MRDLGPDGVGFDLGLKFLIKKKEKKKRFPFECLFGKKILKVREFFGGKKFNMFMLKIYVPNQTQHHLDLNLSQKHEITSTKHIHSSPASQFRSNSLS